MPGRITARAFSFFRRGAGIDARCIIFNIAGFAGKEEMLVHER
jgi:hypothetical protein